MNRHILNKNEIVTIMKGEYSDMYLVGVFRAKKTFDFFLDLWAWTRHFTTKRPFDVGNGVMKFDYIGRRGR